MYKLVSVFNNRRVEIFFTVTIFIDLLPIDKIIRSILIVALFIYFHKDYKPILLGSLILFFVLMNNFALFVVDKEIFNNGEQRYYSVNGTVEGRYLNVGDIIIGDSINISDTKFPKYKIKNEYFRIRLPFYTSLMKIRDYNTEKLYNVSNSNISLLQAIFYGNKRYLNDSVIELFTVTGLNHLLAISGQHVGIILMMIFLILYKIPTKIKFIVSTIFIFLFIPIAGFKIPVLRASVFLFIVSFAYLWDRKVVLSKLVIWVASVFIAIDPEIIYSDSFVLSFLAVLGISMIDFDRYQNKIYLPLLIGLYASAFTLPY
ncbi:MAG: ComEC/Rec2 family competence protein, partial [Deferribacterales bacterium]